MNKKLKLTGKQIIDFRKKHGDMTQKELSLGMGYLGNRSTINKYEQEKAVMPYRFILAFYRFKKEIES